MFWTPPYGKLLCQLYMNAGQKDDATTVASTCYSHVRNRITAHPPIGSAFEPAFTSWIHWAEICGNVYNECGQKYMARHLYETTVQDMKRFNWGSPITKMRNSDHRYFSDIFKSKLEGLGSSSDDEDSSEDDEPSIPVERRLKLIVIKPSEDPSATIECTVNVVDFKRPPTFKALS